MANRTTKDHYRKHHHGCTPRQRQPEITIGLQWHSLSPSLRSYAAVQKFRRALQTRQEKNVDRHFANEPIRTPAVFSIFLENWKSNHSAQKKGAVPTVLYVVVGLKLSNPQSSKACSTNDLKVKKIPICSTLDSTPLNKSIEM